MPLILPPFFSTGAAKVSARQAGLAMCFKLIEAAEGRWRRVQRPSSKDFVPALAGVLRDRGGMK